MSLPRILLDNVRNTWSSTDFVREDVSAYAKRMTVVETRHGLVALSGLLLMLFLSDWILFQRFDLAAEATYICVLLAVLAVHILFSARAIHETQSLQMLGTTLLMISGTAFLLLANTVGSFDLVLFASVTLLFVVVPIVPWGLREASTVLALIYGMFTVSTLTVANGFDAKTLWSLQFMMLGSATISVAMVVRNTKVRKADIKLRFELETANRQMKHQSHKDPLTNAWNRRYLKEKFRLITHRWQERGHGYHFAFLDVDDFKLINDLSGHEIGDQALCSINDAFTRLIEDDGFVVRMGGDEFALLFVADDPAELLRSGLQEIQLACAEISEAVGTDINMSMGVVSVASHTLVTQDDVYRRADAALVVAKSRKTGGVVELNIEQVNLECTDAA